MLSFKIITAALFYIGFVSPANAQYTDTLKTVGQKIDNKS